MAISTSKKGSLAFYGSMFLAGTLLIGGAIFFGKSDKGQIDVSAAIANSNEERQAESEASGETALFTPPPSVSTEPNGGLVGKGVSDTPTPPPPVEESTASEVVATTTASSTEEGDTDTPSENPETTTPSDTDTPDTSAAPSEIPDTPAE